MLGNYEKALRLSLLLGLPPDIHDISLLWALTNLLYLKSFGAPHSEIPRQMMVAGRPGGPVYTIGMVRRQFTSESYFCHIF